MTTSKTFVPSTQQARVIEWVENGSGSAFVEAVAGAGKTSTLIAALAKTDGSVAFAAYNRKIADEIKGKVAKLNLGNRVRVGTFHSFGLNAWRRVYPQVKSGPEAAREKADMTVAQFRKHSLPEKLDTFVLKLVSLAKQRALGLYGQVEDRSQWHAIIDHFDLTGEIEFDGDDNNGLIDKGIDFAIRALKFHRELAPKIIDFDDMVYMPVVSGVRMWENDWVFTDEAQDTNAARRAMVRKMLRKNGRAVFVGDRHQAIYGFTGADNDAIDLIIREFNCATLPLTITFRCPKAVVREAQQTVQHIQADDTAPEGKVSQADYAEFLAPVNLKTLQASDAILCRKTKPLVELAYNLIKNGVACHVEGRDIGAGLLKLVNRFAKLTDLDKLRDQLNAYCEQQTAKLIAKGKETQAEALIDRVETVKVIMDSQPPATTVAELRSRIASMFLDGENEVKPTLTLSTVHKSKGREWLRVFILGRYEFMPSPWARQEWQQEQERNLIYVAVTRSQGELTMISGVETRTQH